MRAHLAALTLLVCTVLAFPAAQSLPPTPAKGGFSVGDILGFPSPDNLVASPVGSTIGWTLNERGVRNIYAADGPAFEPRPVT